MLKILFVMTTLGFPATETDLTGPEQSKGTIPLTQEIAHGGGCRKSSPPGQCCHMDRKAGTVHCH